MAPTAGERPDGSWRARVLILAASAIYGDGLATLAARSQRIDVIGAEAISPDVLARIGALRPDVVVLDVATSENLRLAYQIRVVAPDVRLVAINVPEQDDLIVACAAAEIRGYVPRDGSVDDFLRTVEAVVDGEVRCSPRVAAVLVGWIATFANGPARQMLDLTSREHQILTCLNEGLSNKEIARRLSIETATVKNHIHNVLQKLHVHRRGEAVAAGRPGPNRI